MLRPGGSEHTGVLPPADTFSSAGSCAACIGSRAGAASVFAAGGDSAGAIGRGHGLRHSGLPESTAQCQRSVVCREERLYM